MRALRRRPTGPPTGPGASRRCPHRRQRSAPTSPNRPPRRLSSAPSTRHARPSPTSAAPTDSSIRSAKQACARSDAVCAGLGNRPAQTRQAADRRRDRPDRRGHPPHHTDWRSRPRGHPDRLCLALRRSKLVALTLEDVGHRPGGLLITVRRWKSDTEGRGQVVGVAHGRHTETDPVAALICWIIARGGENGPVFTRCPHGVATLLPIVGETVSRLLRNRATAAGLDPQRITGHSLRAGHATAALAGISLDRIAAHPDTNDSRRCSTTTFAQPRCSTLLRAATLGCELLLVQM